METRANHVLIGLFTLVIILGVFGFILWIARFDQSIGRQPVDVVFKAAVTGLDKGATVLFSGIKIGEVSGLTLDRTTPGQVVARIYIDHNAPVKADTTARIETIGFTGGTVLQMLGGSIDAKPIAETVEPGEIPVIYAEPNQFQDLIDAARQIAARGAALFERLDRLIETNEEAVSQSLKNIETFSDALARNSEQVDQFVKDASEVAGRLNDLVARVDRIVGEEGEDFMAEARAAAQSFRRLADNLNQRADRGVREIEAFAVEGRSTLRDMQRVIDRLERNPSRFFFGRSQVPEHSAR